MLELNLGQVILVLVIQCIVGFISPLNILGMTVLELINVLLVLLVEIFKVFVVLRVPLGEVILQLL